MSGRRDVDPPTPPREAGTRREPVRRRGLVLGLTGPIGCGKSTVAGWLAERGAHVVDADVLARGATASGSPALPAIRGRFGDGVFAADGTLDRGALAAAVFSDPAALADLESIVHPAVHRQILLELDAAEASAAPVVVIEAIKLVETGLAALCDEVWIVDCRLDRQRARLAGRGVPPADAERRIAAQGADLAGRVAAQVAAEWPSLPVRRLVTDGPEAEVRRDVDALVARAIEERT